MLALFIIRWSWLIYLRDAQTDNITENIFPLNIVRTGDRLSFVNAMMNCRGDILCILSAVCCCKYCLLHLALPAAPQRQAA